MGIGNTVTQPIDIKIQKYIYGIHTCTDNNKKKEKKKKNIQKEDGYEKWATVVGLRRKKSVFCLQ